MIPRRASRQAAEQEIRLSSALRARRLVGAALLVSGAVLALVASITGVAAPSLARSSPQLARSFPGGPYFAISCSVSHRSNDDPIVFPGEPGRSHSHTFLGHRATDAFSTPASLVGGRTTCEEPADASAYWVPTLYEGRNPVTPLAAIVYYTNRAHGEISAPPPGLVLLAGDADARSRQPKGIVAWSCGAIGGRPRFHTIPACRPDELLQLQATFPSCWNGRSPDSPDHRQHVRYPRAGSCPSTHPVALPTISLIVLYPPVSPRISQLSSGRLGAHADFMNGWRQDVLERLVAERSVRSRR